MSYEEQIMSKDKHPSIFSPQMEAIVFIILQIFFATRAVLKIGEYLTIGTFRSDYDQDYEYEILRAGGLGLSCCKHGCRRRQLPTKMFQ